MSHPDAETVAALAAEETVAPTVLEHVVGCPACAERVAGIRRVMSSARALETVPAWTTPPSRVWDAILEEINADESSVNQVGSGALHAEVPTEPAPAATVTPIRGRTHRPRSRRLVRWTVGAAAAGLVLGIGGTRVIDRTQEPKTMQVAAVGLDTLDTKRQLGEASVVWVNDAVDLKIDTQPLRAEPDGYLEVWLINTDLKRMVSVGVLGSGERVATFPISADLLAQGYTIVDISREAFDDKPQHSGDSLVRGKLKI